jgi:hypothetical protein
LANEPVYPEIGPTTHFLDHNALIAGFAESGWYKANIPFIDIPDKQIQEVYYYWWQTAHEYETSSRRFRSGSGFRFRFGASRLENMRPENVLEACSPPD